MIDSAQLGQWLIRGSAYTLVGRLIFAGTVVLQNTILARLLTPEMMGTYVLTQSILVPAMLVSLVGTDFLSMRWVGGTQNLAERAAVLRSCAIVVAVGSVLCAAIVIVGLTILSRIGSAWAAVSVWRWLFIPLVVLLPLQTLLSSFFRGLGKIGMATLLNGVLSNVLLLAFVCGVYWWDINSVYDIILLQLVSLLIPVIVGMVGLSAYIDHGTDQTRAKITEIGRLGPRLMLSQVLALIVTQSDIWIVGFFASPDSVAGYGMAARLAQLVSLPLFVICGVLPPLMASAVAERQHVRLERVMNQAVIVALMTALGIASIYAIAGSSILGLLFGRYYGSWGDVLLVLTIGNLVNVAAGPCSQMLIMAGREDTLLNLTLVTCVVCCCGAVIGAKMFGPIGIAVAFAIGLSLQGIFGSHLSLRLTGVRTYPHLASLR
jgi:O-antigen/teichoic acid export membrane protein